jgi:hypothetical protein
VGRRARHHLGRLNASRDGQPLYESMGYQITPTPMMFFPLVKPNS